MSSNSQAGVASQQFLPGCCSQAAQLCSCCLVTAKDGCPSCGSRWVAEPHVSDAVEQLSRLGGHSEVPAHFRSGLLCLLCFFFLCLHDANTNCPGALALNMHYTNQVPLVAWDVCLSSMLRVCTALLLVAPLGDVSNPMLIVPTAGQTDVQVMHECSIGMEA